MAAPTNAPANVLTTYTFLLSKGLTPAQASGIIGNFQVESGSTLDPGATNPTNGAFGIGQWLGGRKSNLQSFAAQSGSNPGSLMVQLNYLWSELTTSESGSLAAIKATTNPTDAAIAFQNAFERCGNPTDCGQSQRVQNANNSFGQLSGIKAGLFPNSDIPQSIVDAFTSSDTSLGFYMQALFTGIGSSGFSYKQLVTGAAWSVCEGPSFQQGAFNPLNTTWPTPHANGTTVTAPHGGPVDLPPGNKAYLGNDPNQNNGDPVKNYSNWRSGIAATVETIWGSQALRKSLADPNMPSINSIGAIIDSAHWGTNPGCIQAGVDAWLKNPNAIVAGQSLQQAVSQNIAGTTPGAGPNDGGGASTGADQGAANPIGFGSLIPGLGGLVDFLSKALGVLTSKAFWTRVGFGLLGLVLVVGGMTFILSETKVGQVAEVAAIA